MRASKAPATINRLSVLLGLSLCTFAGHANDVEAQAPVTLPAVTDVPRVMKAHRITAPIHIDGKLDEAIWSQVPAEGDFVTQWPKDRAPASQKTEARVLYDADAIYVGVRLYDTHPDSIAAQLARRDASGIYSDWFHLMIDSYHDRRTGFRFSVNPKGVQKDVRHFDDRSEDTNWDAVWQVATTIDSLGWIAEYRIPLSQLRYGQADANGSHKWGIQLSRDIARYQERDNWSPIAQTANGFVSRFGDIEDLNNLSAPRRLEAMPYVSGRLTRAPGVDANPFYRKNATTPNVGGDVRVGVGSGLTLTATVNPDFGQVELDPAIVNLSAFEQSFPERRPFFVEGAEIFSFGRLNSNNSYGNLQLLYSRRLGRTPQRGAFGADSFGRRPTFADSPTETSILGALKLSGKTAGGWSIGILDGVTDKEEARLLQTVSPTGGTPYDIRRNTPVEPMTNYFIGRTRRDFRQGRTVVGAILTNTTRKLSERDRPFDLASESFVDGPEVFRPMMNGNATVGGVDFEHNWSNRVYSLSAYAVGSRINGSSTTIANAQRAPYRLYQRPDGSRSVDTSLTSLQGGALGAAILRRGRHWSGSLAYQDYSPGLEINDVGFGQQADRRAYSTEIEYNEPSPKGALKSFRSYGSWLFTTSAYNYDGNNVYQQVGGGGYAQRAKSLWNFNVSGGYQPGVFSDRLLRGGPLAKSPDSYYGNVNVTTDPRKMYVLNFGANGNRDDFGGYNGGLYSNVDVRPRTYLRVSIGPSINHGVNMTQYVARVSDSLATSTFGSRYLFAQVEQTTFSLSTRINWTFTPRLTLEVVAQPFVSSGAYSDFKYFRTPRQKEYVTFGGNSSSSIVRDSAKIVLDADAAGPSKPITVTNPDFTLRSMRGSAVMRWEYRPGSTLFFVWQQNRSGSTADGTLAPRDFSRAFSEPGQNVFLIKASYWLSR